MSNAEREGRARDWIAALCDIPARFAGSVSEHMAAEKVGQWMRQIGVGEIRTDAVVSRPRTGWALALHAGVVAFGLYWGGPMGALIAVFAAYSFQREFSGGRLLLSTVLPCPPSLNVIGRAGAAGAPRRVVLSAHIDTAQAGWLFSPALADNFARRAKDRQGPQKPPPGPLALPRALILGGALLAVFGWMGAHGLLFALTKWIVLGGLALAVGLTLQWANSPATPGANDNASAVASMLTCAETLLGAMPGDVELWLVGTGAEEVGCRGMHGFVESRLDWSGDDTLYLNFECTGGGQLHYIRSEGVMGKFGYPPTLLEEARRMTRKRTEFADITPTDLLAATDGHVSAHHGFPTLSLISLEANGVPRNYHRPEDTVEALDLGMVVRAADFGAAVVLAALGR